MEDNFQPPENLPNFDGAASVAGAAIWIGFLATLGIVAVIIYAVVTYG